MKQLVLFLLLGLFLACSGSKPTVNQQSTEKIAESELVKLKAMAASDSAKWDTHYTLAKHYRAQGDLQAANEELETALSKNPLALQALYDQAEIQLELHNPVEGYSRFLKLVQTQGGEQYVSRIASRIGKPYETRQITHGDHNNAAPNYSPDNKSIVFQTDRDGNMEIYTLELESHYERRITSNPARDELPAFSKSGKMIAFTSTRGDSSDVPKAEKKREIFMYGVEKSATIQITKNQDDDWYPRFDPKGKNIVFVSSRGDIRDKEFCNLWSDLYLLNLKSGNTERLTEMRTLTGCPVFGRDGKSIIFNSRDDEKFHLYQISLEQKQIAQLTAHRGNDAVPSVNPKRDEIAFFSDKNGNFDIFRLNLATQKIEQLTNEAYDEAYPDYASDGKKLVYQAMVKEKYQIFELDFEKPLTKASLVKCLENKMTEHSHQTAGNES